LDGPSYESDIAPQLVEKDVIDIPRPYYLSKTKAVGLNRWLHLDALRGVAVILMVGQHMNYWLYGQPQGNWGGRTIGALGGLAAPIFVTLSGLGAALSVERYPDCDRILMIRGLYMIGLGVVLNLLTPHWFSPQSWYILHLIGLALAVSPVLRRAPNRVLIAAILVVLVATILIQNNLETPFRLFNRHMAVAHKPGGLLRLAIAEGFFPVFPWIAFFMAGMLAGRWLLAGRSGRIWQLGAGLLLILTLLLALHATGWQAIRTLTWIRFFKWIPSFYPALTPITLCLIAVSLLLVYGAVRLINRFPLQPDNFLVCLGRASLTILIVHVVVIRGSAVHFRFWQRFSLLQSLMATCVVLLLFALISVRWQKVNFRYGAEWLLRRSAGGPDKAGKAIDNKTHPGGLAENRPADG
jgi:uncharacterized membrane protein